MPFLGVFTLHLSLSLLYMRMYYKQTNTQKYIIVHAYRQTDKQIYAYLHVYMSIGNQTITELTTLI